MKRVSRGIAPLFLLLPSASWALGLGDIRVETALNEPLVAEIPVLSASKKDLRDMKVRLAPKAAFAKLGLDRSYVLTQLRFTPTTVNGRPVIRITSRKPIREPFLDFLIEVNWPKGRLVREYTVLLDPPTLLERRAAPGVQAAQTAAPSAAYRFDQPAGPASEYGGPRVSGGWPETVEVRPGDSLYRIARRLAPQVAGMGVEQLMVALYEANPQAFGGNMNLLRAGTRLRVPGADEVSAIEPAAARAEIARQTEQWSQQASSVAATPSEPEYEVVSGPAPAAQQAAAEATTAGAEPPAARQEPVPDHGAPQAHLEIVAPAEETGSGADSGVQAGGGSGAADESADVQASLALAREVAKAREEENTALKSRLSQLEEMLKRSERIIELQNRELEALRERIARLEAGVSAEPANAATQADTAEQAQKEPVGAGGAGPADAKKTAAAAARAEPAQDQKPYSTLDVLMDNPMWLYGVGAGGALLLLLALLALRRRRSEDDVVGEPERRGAGPLATGALATGALATGGVAATRETAEAISTGMFEAAKFGTEGKGDPDLEDTQKIHPSELAAQGVGGGAGSTDVEDVLSEADVYIAYGLYQQAEELLQEALDQDPKNADYYVKLAETYQRDGRPEALARLAEKMREAGLGEGEAWESVAALGRKVDPENPLYAGSASEAGEPHAEAATDQEGVDLDLDEELPEAADATAWDLDTGALPSKASQGTQRLSTGFSEAADLERVSGEEAAPDAQDQAPPESLKTVRETAADAADSNILEFDTEDLGLQDASAQPEGPSEPEVEAGGLTEEIQSELETRSDLDLDLTDVELRMPEGLESGAQPELHDSVADSPEETVELDESLLQELESAISEIQDSGMFETPEGGSTEGTPSDTVFLEDELPAGAETEVVSQPTEGLEDVLELDTLMDDEAKMTFEVEPRAGDTEQDEPETGDTEIIDPASVGGESSDTLVTDSGFTNMLGDSDEAETKLELARAYLEMGDSEGARATLEEVLESASEEHRRQAEALLRSIG